MKLIGSLTSPFVRKVRIVLAEKKLDYKFEVEDVWSADSRIAQANPLGKVPCLVMDGGEAIFDSRVIVEYVDTLSPVGKLIPLSGRERVEVRTWEALADGLLDAAVLARMEQTWSGRTEAQRSPAWINRQLDKVHQSLKAFSQALVHGHPPQLGRHCSGLCSGLPRLPLPGHRLAHHLPQPRQALRQADAAPQFHRHDAPFSLNSHPCLPAARRTPRSYGTRVAQTQAAATVNLHVQRQAALHPPRKAISSTSA